MRKFSGPLLFSMLLILLSVLLGTGAVAKAAIRAPDAIGWVGNMFPASGSSNVIVEGATLDVYVQVWEDSVTNPAGQGANISCTLQWGAVPAFGSPWTTTIDTPMTYNTDIGNNDEYTAAIMPAEGLYEFTAFCSDLDDGGDIYSSNPSGNGRLTVNPPAVQISGTRALWLDSNTIAWNGVAGSSYKLLRDADGALDLNTAVAETLTANGVINGAAFPKNPNTDGLIQLDLPGTLNAADKKALLKEQLVVASYDGGGGLLDATAVQIQGVLDDLYATAAATESLGVAYNAGVPTVRLWAPTAKSVTLRHYADSTTATFSDHVMSADSSTGVWSVTGVAGWDKQFYLFDVEVYVPQIDAVVHNLVTDPYAVSLATNSVRSQFVDLSDTADTSITPSGWTSFSKPALAAPEDIAVYEVHVRDFSRDDTTVTAVNRGTYKAFTETGSDGMSHLLALQAAGLTHVHFMPAFDIASVDEVTPRADPNPTGFDRDSDQQQTAVGAGRDDDSFNWGYDPYHYGVPEGSYSTDPDGVTRIIEFREMVQTLNEQGLRVVMDVVYNHTAAVGQEDKSVLDKIVPGYYYRYTLDGSLENSSCCADTAAEYAMMEKLLVDTMVRWATDYKVDGFRFDLMNLHTVQNAINARDAVQAVDPDIYVYGEGWDFGSAAAKGLNYAKQTNMTGYGIGTFNDRLRDAAHGGYNSDALQIRHQGFINGLSYDWNDYLYNNRDQSDLHTEMGRLRTALAGSIADYTADPQETVNYVSKHDNETLFDQNVFKMPTASTMDARVRAQNMGLSVAGLAQGVPFFHMGSDIMRSKSLDRNSYDSGDWFNRIDWTKNDNNFGKGLPPAWDNNSRWAIMGPLLANTALDPATADMQANAAHLREVLRLRNSSKLFRLETAVDINARVAFFNSDNNKDALLVMGLSDAVGLDLDANYEYILVFFNANKISQTFTIAGANGFGLHPLQADATDADPVVQTATFDEGSDTFTIPPRTTAVFVSTQAVTPPSSLDWVGLMWPRGGMNTSVETGGATADFTVYVQVYEPGITGDTGSHTGLSCTLNWGQYGTAWTDLAMSRNIGYSDPSNDEYMAVLSQSTLNNLTAGTYGYNIYCQKDGEVDKKWKVDAEEIDGNANSASDFDIGHGILSLTPATDVSPAPTGGVFVHLFEWKWTDIEKECFFLAQKGYAAIQVSPPMEHVVPTADQGGDADADYPWWVRYQPVDYSLDNSRSGTLAAFQDMVTTCNNLGVDVYVDAVINHMTGLDPDTAVATGTSGSSYQHYDYPAYDPSDFYTCGTNSGAGDASVDNINSYKNRFEVQKCELLNLADLDTEDTAVQTEIRAYLQSLLDIGVAGFRIDAAKHMFTYDIEQVLAGLSGDYYLFQEVIDLDASEPVREDEYFINGDVTEFSFSQAMADKFNGCNGTISDLATLSSYSGMMASQFGVTFTDNHDNQRGHGPGGAFIVDYRDGVVYDLANIFMLAHPYGYPKVMSSYYWDGSHDSYGPPSTAGTGAGSGADTISVYGPGQIGGDDPLRCEDSTNWVCEHRRIAIANMVQFRSVTAGQPISDWWDNGGDQIAFGRNDHGYVAINRENSVLTRTFQTSLAAGEYCDVTKGELTPDVSACTGPTLTVDGSGQIVGQAVAAMDAFAIHTAAKIGSCLATFPPVDFNVDIMLPAATTDVRLDWFAYGAPYDVRYSTSDPYFATLTGTQLLPIPPTNNVTHENVTDIVSIAYYYRVQVDNCSGQNDSQRVGLFNFGLIAGD